MLTCNCCGGASLLNSQTLVSVSEMYYAKLGWWQVWREFMNTKYIQSKKQKIGRYPTFYMGIFK